MKSGIIVYSCFLAFTEAFTPVGKYNYHPPTALNGLGDRFKKLINRNKETVAVLEREEEEVAIAKGTDVVVADDAIAGTEEEIAVVVTSELKTDAETELSETQKLMKQVKDSGVAGVISYALWEVSPLTNWFCL
jgi:hypothetical protein